MKPKNSCGLDTIPIKLIKLASPIVTPFLTKLINDCITNGIFPKCLKQSRVIPLYKSGDVHDPSNYRPISLLSCISKIFEKVLKAQLYRYLIKFNILSDSQFGFREKLSTVDAIVSLCESIGKIENCSKTEFFWISKKAFDTVNHKTLIEKLESYGVRGKTLALFENCLNDRFQCVETDGEF